MRRTVAVFIASARLILAALPLPADDLSVSLAVQSEDVYVGEQFAVQIKVEGSSSPEQPSLAAVKDFGVRFIGGQNTSAEYVSISNGKVTRTASLGYVFNYQFAARRAGNLVIPAIAVQVEGKTLATEPVRIAVTKPSEAEDFRLVVEPAETQPYVGEGLALTVTWYISAPVRNVYFLVPFLKGSDFRVLTPEVDTTPSGKYAQVVVNDEETIVELQDTTYQGKPYTSVRFTKVVTPLKGGTFSIPESTVQFEARVGRQRQGSLFDSFFDTTGDDYRPFVASSAKGSLRVLALPAQGAPKGFGGHVGRYLLRASASPLEATVGDPIALTLTLAGPSNVLDAPAPVLAGQRIARDFVLQDGQPQSVPPATGTRVPEKGFTYTVRASRAGITEIPPVELPYFDPKTGRYEVARSSPVPIRIVNARVVTSQDAEGSATPTTETAAVVEDSATEGGIAHNYEGADALRRQYRGLAGLVRRPAILLLLLLSAAAVGTSAALTTGRRIVSGRARDGRGSFRSLSRRLREIAEGGPAEPSASLAAVLSGLTGYFSHRLGLPPGAGTFADVEAALRPRELPQAPLDELRDVYRICEAGRYAGYPLSVETAREISRRALAACAAIEERLAGPRRSPFAPRALCGLLAAGLLAAAPPLRAESAEDPAALFARATETFRAANEAAEKHPAAASELYAESAALLERLIVRGERENGRLYYNLGNAYYRLGDLGRAILAYRRAELLEPADSNLEHNLAQARFDREDTIESRPGGAIARVLLFWHHDLSPGTRSVLFALCFTAAAASISAWFFLRKRPLLRVAAGLAVPTLLLLGSLTVDQIRLGRRREGVIVASEVIARRGDGEIYQPAFQRPLHAGTEFVLREERHSWYLIEIPDGRRCWVPDRAAELLVEDRNRSPR